MTAIIDWTSLCTTSADFMNRTDVVPSIPSFVTLAEAEMNRKLKVRQMLARNTATIASEFEAVPSDFAGAQALTLDATPTIQLEYADPDKILYEKSRTTTIVGPPRLYSVQGDDIQLFPAPDGIYTARIVYFQRIPALSASLASNWLLRYSPDAYLYGSLSQGGFWLRGDPRFADWVNAFETILDNINEANRVEADAPRLEMPSRLVV